MPRMPQSWSDLVVMDPMDPRSIISSCSFQDSSNVAHAASFIRSSTWLHASTWVNPPMIISTSSTSNVQNANPQDFDAAIAANVWNGTHQMTTTNSQLPLSASKLVFLKSDPRFINTIFLDWTGGTTSSSDIELSFRDNSATSGSFQHSGQGTIPVFSFPASTWGGTGKAFTVSLLRTGRFSVAIRIIDNGGNYSMFEMDWIVLD